MNFQEKIQQMKNKLFDLISTKEITYLKELNKNIKINKEGKFYYSKIIEINNSNLRDFLSNLDDKSIKTLIILYSKDDKTDEPYIVLTQQILITNNSMPLLIYNLIMNKLDKAIELYNIDLLNLNGKIIFKYKKVKINFNEFNSFE
jgi:alanyl-tRNA synthetase